MDSRGSRDPRPRSQQKAPQPARPRNASGPTCRHSLDRDVPGAFSLLHSLISSARIHGASTRDRFKTTGKKRNVHTVGFTPSRYLAGAEQKH